MQPAAVQSLELESVVTYRHICKIASGGMGEVRLAMRRGGSFVRLYAIKRLHPHLKEDPDVRASFLEEARIAGLLRHPNVVSVVDVGEDSEGPFLVMEYVDGLPLSAIANRAKVHNQPIPLGVALRIVMHAAQGLAAAHELTTPDGSALELVHRDVSPQNILVAFDGTARVADFGIARALGRQTRTATGLVKGKLGYLAPESLLFRPSDHRTDLFALGVVLFELVAGRRLYGGKELEESARRILEEPPPDLGDEREDVPPDLVGLVFKLLAKSPDARPPDARAVVRTLETVLAELTSAGELTDIGEYMGAIFGDERVQRQKVVAEAIDAAEKTTAFASGPHLAVHTADTARIERPHPAKRAGIPVRTPWAIAIAAGAIASGALALTAWAIASRPSDTPAPIAASAPDVARPDPLPQAPPPTSMPMPAATIALPAPPAAQVPAAPPPAVQEPIAPAPPIARPPTPEPEVHRPASDPPAAQQPAPDRRRTRPRNRGAGGNDDSHLWGWDR